MTKIEAKEIVKLSYVIEPVSVLVLKIESVFFTLLSEDINTVYVIRIVADIFVALGMKDVDFGNFFFQPHDTDVKIKVIHQIIFRMVQVGRELLFKS